MSDVQVRLEAELALAGAKSQNIAMPDETAFLAAMLPIVGESMARTMFTRANLDLGQERVAWECYAAQLRRALDVTNVLESAGYPAELLNAGTVQILVDVTDGIITDAKVSVKGQPWVSKPGLTGAVNVPVPAVKAPRSMGKVRIVSAPDAYKQFVGKEYIGSTDFSATGNAVREIRPGMKMVLYTSSATTWLTKNGFRWEYVS